MKNAGPIEAPATSLGQPWPIAPIKHEAVPKCGGQFFEELRISVVRANEGTDVDVGRGKQRGRTMVQSAQRRRAAGLQFE
jgi:hypothetical protein